MLDLIQQDHASPQRGRDLVGAAPDPLPRSGEGLFGPVPRRIERVLAELFGDLEQQGRLSHLPRACEELDPGRRRLGNPLAKQVGAGRIGHDHLVGHTRIIIRLC